jgi:C-terminal processing protease CtpA/Prc
MLCNVQIGVILNGTTIVDTVVGGPGYNSRQLMPGDVILKIDGVSVTSANITSAMIGRDIPGATLTLTIAKGGTEVSLESIAKIF